MVTGENRQKVKICRSYSNCKGTTERRVSSPLQSTRPCRSTPRLWPTMQTSLQRCSQSTRWARPLALTVVNCGTYFLFLRLKQNPESLLFTLCKRLESAGWFLSQSFLCSSESGNIFSFVTHIVLASRWLGIIFLYSIRTEDKLLLRTGPHEDVAKLYLMEQTKTEEISQQVAAFLRWPSVGLS